MKSTHILPAELLTYVAPANKRAEPMIDTCHDYSLPLVLPTYGMESYASSRHGAITYDVYISLGTASPWLEPMGGENVHLSHVSVPALKVRTYNHFVPARLCICVYMIVSESARLPS